MGAKLRLSDIAGPSLMLALAQPATMDQLISFRSVKVILVEEMPIPEFPIISDFRIILLARHLRGKLEEVRELRSLADGNRAWIIEDHQEVESGNLRLKLHTAEPLGGYDADYYARVFAPGTEILSVDALPKDVPDSLSLQLDLLRHVVERIRPAWVDRVLALTRPQSVYFPLSEVTAVPGQAGRLFYRHAGDRTHLELRFPGLNLQATLPNPIEQSIIRSVRLITDGTMQPEGYETRAYVGFPVISLPAGEHPLICDWIEEYSEEEDDYYLIFDHIHAWINPAFLPASPGGIRVRVGGYALPVQNSIGVELQNELPAADTVIRDGPDAARWQLLAQVEESELYTPGTGLLIPDGVLYFAATAADPDRPVVNYQLS